MEDDQFLRRLECLALEIESCTDPAIRERLRGAIGIVLDFHGRALNRLMQHLAQSGDTGQVIFDMLGADELVSSLLLLHDLHPWDLHTRLKHAIERANPQWEVQGAQVQLVGITADGIVQLKLMKTHQGWPSSPSTMKTSIERVVYAAAPDATGVTIEGLDEGQPRPGFVPLSALRILKAG